MAYDVPAVLGDLSIPALRASGSMKWSAFPRQINSYETLPCFVAEMDFAVAQPIRDALVRWASNEPLGYRPGELVENFQRTIVRYYAANGLRLLPTNVRPISDVMTAYDVVARLFTEPTAPITLMTPTYMNFVGHIFGDRRRVQHVEMLAPDEDCPRWRVDWQALDQALSAGGMLVLVNPHNPLGKVYSYEELADIAALASRHGVRVYADEIHAPLIYEGKHQIPFASVSPQAADVAITAFSATKAYSTPGTKAASLVFTNDADLQLWKRHCGHFEMGTATSGYVATIAALEHAQSWFDSAMSQLHRNRQLFSELVAKHLPDARYTPPEGSYLGWLDLRGTRNYEAVSALVTDTRSLSKVTAQQCGVIATDGAETGSAGEGHLRINFATGPEVITQILQRLGRVYSQ